MADWQRYSFKSPEEAIQFFAQKNEDRFKDIEVRLTAIESAMKAMFYTSPDAVETALAMADSYEVPPTPVELGDRLSAVAAQLRRLASFGQTDAKDRLFSVVKGGRKDDTT